MASAPAALTDTVLDMPPVPDAPPDAAPPQPASHAGVLAQTSPEGIPAVPEPLSPAGLDPAVATLRPRGDGRAGSRLPAGMRLAAARRLAVPPRLSDAWRLAFALRLPVPPRFAVPWSSPAQRAAWRSAASGYMPWAVVATVVPLCLLQVPFGEFAQFADAATAVHTAGWSAVSLQSGSLGLPFLVAVAPLSVLAVRWLGTWSMLLGGLIVIAAGDVLAGLGGEHVATSAALAGTVSALHGAGAGLAFPATAALAAECSAAWARAARRGWPLAAWWAAVTVFALAVAPGLNRSGLAAGGWRTAFGPVPWLIAVALAAVILDPLLAGRLWPLTWRADRAGNQAKDSAGDRTGFPPAERVQFTLLIPSAAALAIIAVAVSYQPRDTLVAAAFCEVAGLCAVAAIILRGIRGIGWLTACAAAGFVLAPASAALLSLRVLAVTGTAGPGAADAVLAAAAVVGAVLGAAGTARAAKTSPSGPHPVAGLLLAGTALIVASLTGPFASLILLGVLVAAVTGGLAAVLAREAREVTVAGAMAGVVILACGTLVGYLAAAAIRAQFGPASAGGQHPVPHGLVIAFDWWALAGAAAAVTVAIIPWIPRVRRELGRPGPGRLELCRREFRRHEPPRHQLHRHDPFRDELSQHQARGPEPGRDGRDPGAARHERIPRERAGVERARGAAPAGPVPAPAEPAPAPAGPVPVPAEPTGR